MLSMQNPSWWFAYWPWDTQDNLQITPYVLRSLIDIQNYTNIDIQKNIDLARIYLEANQNVWTELQQSQIAWALAKAKSDVLDVDFIIENLNNTELPSSARLFYTYALYEISWKLYSDIVEKNINILKKSSFPTSDYYWDSQSFQAILASLIVEYWWDETYINKKVDDFYKKELSSYYYSTQTKNNIFQFFYKYLAQTWVWKRSEVEFYHKWTSQRISLWWKNPWFIKQELNAKDFVIGNNIVLPFEYISWENIFIDVSVLEYPKDVKKIKPYKNKLTLSRKIYEVTDSWEKLVTWNTYHLWKLYRTEVSVITDDSITKTNLTIEDYLPAWFLVSNSKFKTVATEEKTSHWYYFERVESKPEVFFSTTSFPQWEVIQSYYFRPQYPGTFVYPPVSAYYMYEPEIRAYSRYDTIIVK
jgi:hypothetical protein